MFFFPFSVKSNFFSLMNTESNIFTRGQANRYLKYCFWCSFDEINFDPALKKQNKTKQQQHMSRMAKPTKRLCAQVRLRSA